MQLCFPISTLESVVLDFQDSFLLQFHVNVNLANSCLDANHSFPVRQLSKIVTLFLRNEADCWNVVNDLRRLYFKMNKEHLKVKESDTFKKKSVSLCIFFVVLNWITLSRYQILWEKIPQILLLDI
jgi:hypothetical protein